MVTPLTYYQPLSEAPPATAISRTLVSVNRIPASRAFMCSMATSPLRPDPVPLDFLLAALVFWGTRKPTRQDVGRLHYSLPRHPKCPFQVRDRCVRLLTLLPSTGVLASGRTLRTPNPYGQYGTLPIPTGTPGSGGRRLAGCERPSRSGRTAQRQLSGPRSPCRA
jgi:hypothetical protein